ncbi:hypothetical protein SB773_33535, partial [Bacillus sp. SIMBA_074]|uniref:hypothetical protein n=1 Tax=Bacillus sp. SIMBA_074 TaxID=3085812 RepID=UPI00397E6D2F
LNVYQFEHDSEPKKSAKFHSVSLPEGTIVEYLQAKEEKTVLYNGFHYIKCRVLDIPTELTSLEGKFVWLASGKNSKFDRLMS